MKIKFIILAAFLIPSFAIASGSSGGFSGSSSSVPSARQVDQAYEYGKSLYNGRSKEVAKFDYCVAGEEELVKVKRSSLKTFKGASYEQLANNLYDCDNPEKSMLDHVDTTQAAYIIYYLDKRYKLDLENGG